MPKTRKDLLENLNALGIHTQTVEHPPLFTVEESQALRGSIPGAHSKNLFLKDKKGSLFLVVAREDAEIDLKRLHTRIGASGRLSFGKPDLLMEKLGVEPGSVTPFAVINDTGAEVTLVIDASMMEETPLNFHPLENTATTTIDRDDLLVFLRAAGHDPQILNISL